MGQKIRQKRPFVYMIKLFLMGPGLLLIGYLFIYHPPPDLVEEIPVYKEIGYGMAGFGVACLLSFFSPRFHSLMLSAMTGAIAGGCYWWFTTQPALEPMQQLITAGAGLSFGIVALVCFVAFFTGRNPFFRTLRSGDAEGLAEDMGIEF